MENSRERKHSRFLHFAGHMQIFPSRSFSFGMKQIKTLIIRQYFLANWLPVLKSRMFSFAQISCYVVTHIPSCYGLVVFTAYIINCLHLYVSTKLNDVVCIHKGLADSGGYYMLRAQSSLQNNDDKEATGIDQTVVSTFVKAVSFYYQYFLCFLVLMYHVIMYHRVLIFQWP